MTDSKSSSLRPTAPSLTKRYNKCSRVEPLHATIPTAFFTHAAEPEPQYLPLGWTSCTHPEGQLYFHCDSRSLKVVTEDYLYQSTTLQQILHWTDEVVSLIGRLGIPVTDSTELYLELDPTDESSCLYYLVDHSTRTTFWLEPIPTTLLNISPIVSTSHLKLALEELYWNHVEYFPTHLETSFRAVDDLISVFTHAQADCMTSEYSTFPYTSVQSTRFLKLLRPYQGKEIDGHIICFVARLWGVVASHRFSTHYGQEHCRLSRDQTILSTPERGRHWLSLVLSRLMFGLPAVCVDKFESLWIDDIVYAEQWREFMTYCQEDRKLIISWAFGSMTINLITLAFSIGSRSLAFSSVSFAYGSIISGLALFIRQQRLTKATAPEAAVYIQDIKHNKYGFQFISLLYSLPKAFLIWSLALYILQGPIIAFQALGLLTTAVLTVVLSILLLTLRLVLCPVSMPRPFWASRRQKDDNCSRSNIV